MSADTAGRWLGWLLLAGFGALVLAEALRYFRTALAPEGLPAPAEAPRVSRRRLWAETAAALVASRLLVGLVCLGAYLIEYRSAVGFGEALWWRMFPWDADHYLFLIENGYVAAGDEALFIVFFPLYPMLCRGVARLTGAGAVPVALAVSNLSLLGCGAAMYRLGELDGAARGRRAMLLLMACPMTYFFSVAYSESLFLLVTLLAVLCARRGRFTWAVLFGALASGARVLGLAVAVPIFWEILRRERDERGPVTAGRMALCVAKVLPVSAGFLAYLALNWKLFGDPLRFMAVQSEHWFQNFGSIGNTLRYSLVNALDYHDHLYQLGVWRPQVLLLVAVPLLVLWRRRRMRPGDSACLLVYFYVAFAPTWLLSGPRYAAACYALYPMLAGIPRTRRGFIALLAGECAALAFMTWVGLWMGKAY